VPGVGPVTAARFVAALDECRTAAPLRPGLHVRERGLPAHARRLRHHLLDEPPRQLL
jgi:hypothetical protein